jgi:YbbR domain-containing protein
MKSLLLRNAWLKALALALSILLWYSITGQRRQRVSERGYVIPLAVVNVPSSLVIASSIPDTVDVRLKGPFQAIRLADPSKMEAVMDLTGSLPGDHVYNLTTDDINAPEDLEVVSLNPSSIPVRLEPLARRDVPIVARFVPPGARVTARVDPPAATVTGPRSRIQKIRAIPTDPISLEGKPADFRVPAILSVEPNVRVVSPKGVVYVTVHQEPGR